jgi:signal peptidase I
MSRSLLNALWRPAMQVRLPSRTLPAPLLVRLLHQQSRRQQSSSSSSAYWRISRHVLGFPFYETAWKFAKFSAWFPVIIFVNDHVVRLWAVTGPSMQPTLSPIEGEGEGWVDTVLALRWDSGCRGRSKQVVERRMNGVGKMEDVVEERRIWYRGDVVVLTSPLDPERIAVKRVVGIEGDRVQTRHHPDYPPYPEKWVVVPKGNVWVEGDEGFRGIDSNVYGPVSV